MKLAMIGLEIGIMDDVSIVSFQNATLDVIQLTINHFKVTFFKDFLTLLKSSDTLE